MQGGGWRAWVVNNARAARPNEARNEIDRLRAELRGDFRSALRHAYVGPRSGLPHGLLLCFLLVLWDVQGETHVSHQCKGSLLHGEPSNAYAG